MRLTVVLVLLAVFKCSNAWSKCEKITIARCQELGYNLTTMPNFIGHETQDEAERTMEKFMPLVHLNCSPHLQFFLCSILAPLCSEYVVGAIPSCRRVCEEIQADCLPVLDGVDFPWLTIFNCSRFPENGLCMQFPTSRTEERRRVQQLEVTSNELSGTADSKTSWCPKNFVRAREPTSPVCSPICDTDAYYTKDEKLFTRRWLSVWAWFCFSSTLFTLLTFMLEPGRFRYPERPIIFVTLCYNILSATYMVINAFDSYSLICVTQSPVENTTSYIVTNGLEKPSCIITFLITYYLSMSANIWWVVLTVTWFLSAARQWSSEALENLSSYFHTFAWAVPAVFSVLALTLHKVSGNELTNFCQVSEPATFKFLVVPHLILLSIGSIIGLFTAFALVQVRHEMRSMGHSTLKLEKLIKRLAVLGLMYLIPSIGSLGCMLFEALYQPRQHSLEVLSNLKCFGDSNDSICQPDLLAQTDGVTVTLLQIFLSLLIGIMSGMWVWTGKTYLTWKKLLSSSKVPMGPVSL